MSDVHAGWYPDPNVPGLQRWWDGRAWTSQIRSASDAPQLMPPPDASAAGAPKAARRVPLWVWGIAVAVLIGVTLAVPKVAMVLALVVLVTAIVALVKKRRTWLRFRSATGASVATGIATVVLVVAASMPGVGSDRTSPPDAAVAPLAAMPSTSVSPASTPRSTPRPTPTPSPTPKTVVTEVTAKESVAFAQSQVDDANLERGQTRVDTVGVPGERTITYRVTTVDGVETAREVVSDIVTTEPIAEVTAIGVYDPPRTIVGDASGCDPNYADACVPIASDVDCAWGSGNGPAYLDGVARVVGTDIYDLDRDGDGYACERD